MRGTIHLLTPEEAGAALSLLAAGKSWHRPSWQRYFKMTVAQMEELRFAIRDALDGRVLTREELIAEITRLPGHAHLGDALRSGWGTLLKPSAWQGDLVFGPNRGTRVTFTRPDSASKRWVGVPDAEEAGPVVVRRYLAAYGPATPANFAAWLFAIDPPHEGLVRPRQRRRSGGRRRPAELHSGRRRRRPGCRPTNPFGPTAGRLRPVGAWARHAGHQRAGRPIGGPRSARPPAGSRRSSLSAAWSAGRGSSIGRPSAWPGSVRPGRCPRRRS